MNRQELDGLIKGAIRATNTVTDEIETMFGLLSSFAAGGDPPAWVATGRTYARDVRIGKAARPRALPQSLYRLFLPASLATRADADADDDNGKTHVRVDPRTQVLVVAAVLYPTEGAEASPQVVAARMSKFEIPKSGGRAGQPAGLRRKHLKGLLAEVDLGAVKGSCKVGPMAIDGLKVGCQVDVLLREPLTSVSSGAELETLWRRILVAAPGNVEGRTT